MVWLTKKHYSSRYKNSRPFEYRKSSAESVRRARPSFIPLIVEPVETGKRVVKIKNHKIAVPMEWKVVNLIDRIKSMFDESILTESESITVHLGEPGTQPLPSNTLGDLYHEHHDEDMFLYVHYQVQDFSG